MTCPVFHLPNLPNLRTTKGCSNQPINQQSDTPHARAVPHLSLIISQNLRKTEDYWAARNVVSKELQNEFCNKHHCNKQVAL